MRFSASFPLVFGVATLAALPFTAQAQHRVYSSAHRDSEHNLPQAEPTGNDGRLNGKLVLNRTGVSLVVADFDQNGYKDLISGYTTAEGSFLLLQRGSPLAIEPTPNEWAMTARGELVTPYGAKSEAIDVPVRPDLLLPGDFSGSGKVDLLLAAKGDSTAYLLAGKGDGTFLAPRAMALSGPISALRTWRSPAGATLIAAAVRGSRCGVDFFAADGSSVGFVPTAAPVTSLELGVIHNGNSQDMLAVAGGEALLVDGDSILSGTPVVETLAVSGAVAAQAGRFLYDFDGRMQIAVLDGEATLHILARGALNPHQATDAERHAARAATRLPGAARPVAKGMNLPWMEVESTPNFGSGTGSPTLLSGHFTGSGQDDLALLAGGQYIQLIHTSHVEGANRVTTPILTVDSTSGTVTAVAVTRVSADGRFGLVEMGPGGQPRIAVPTVRNTWTVNTTADATPTTASIQLCTSQSVGCTLRSAIAAANEDDAMNGTADVDTININPGTYVISATNGSLTDSDGDVNYRFNIAGGVNLVGAGQTSTIINANSKDNIFKIGSDNNDFDTFLTSMTLENGLNSNNPSVNEQSLNYVGGLVDWLPFPGTNSYLTINSVTMTASKALWGQGGAVAAVIGTSTGPVEIDNSTVSNNATPEAGGGMFIYDGTPIILTNDMFSGNQALTSVNPADPDGVGSGGGIYSYGGIPSKPDTISGVTFSGNSSTREAGGFEDHLVFAISGTTFSGNTAGTVGGGLVYTSSGTSSITSSNFTTNKASGGQGGGINLLGASGTLTVHYSRFHGNTSPGYTYTGAYNTGGGTLNATDNWWGCNTPPSGSGCDAAGGSSTAITPYTVLTESIPPALGYDEYFVATGSLGQDSAGTIYSQSNDAAYDGLPATNTIVQSTGTINSEATALAYSATIAAQATTAPGTNSATVTVDGFSVTQTFTVNASDFTVTSTTGAGPYLPGGTGLALTLTVTNSGDGPSTGTVTVTDSLPTGLTATAINGSGWTCTLSSLTCTRSDVLAVSTSYPAITLTYSISSTAIGNYTNTVTVANAGEDNTQNDTGTSTISVEASPVMALGIAPASIAYGATAVETWTITNSTGNVAAFTSMAFTDNGFGGAGILIAPSSGIATNCPSGTASVGSGGTSVSLSGATLAVGASCTVTVNITAAVGSYTASSSAATAANANASNIATAPLTVTADATTTTVTSVLPNSVTTGGTSTLTATVTDKTTPANTPTGSLIFYDTVGGSKSTIATVTLSNGTATYAYSVPTVGVHTITAAFVAGNFGGSSDATGKTITVTQATPAPNAIATYQVKTGTSATIAVIFGYPGTVAPAGTVTMSVSVNGSNVGLTPVTCVAKAQHRNCSATFSASSVAVGNYTLTYSEAADANYTAQGGTSTIQVTN